MSKYKKKREKLIIKGPETDIKQIIKDLIYAIISML